MIRARVIFNVVEGTMIDRQPNDNVPKSKHFLSVVMILFVLALGITIGTLISNHRVDAVGPGDSQLQMQAGGKPVAGGAFLPYLRLLKKPPAGSSRQWLILIPKRWYLTGVKARLDKSLRIRMICSAAFSTDLFLSRSRTRNCGIAWDRE